MSRILIVRDAYDLKIHTYYCYIILIIIVYVTLNCFFNVSSKVFMLNRRKFDFCSSNLFQIILVLIM